MVFLPKLSTLRIVIIIFIKVITRFFLSFLFHIIIIFLSQLGITNNSISCSNFFKKLFITLLFLWVWMILFGKFIKFLFYLFMSSISWNTKLLIIINCCIITRLWRKVFCLIYKKNMWKWFWRSCLSLFKRYEWFHWPILMILMKFDLITIHHDI